MKEKYYVVAKTISRWKLDNKFENWLGYKADKSEFWKRLYVLYYRLFDNEYYWGGIKLADKEIVRQIPNVESGHRIMLEKSRLKRDMLYSLHRFGTSFEEYFIYKFYGRNFVSRSTFNNLKMQYGYCELVNSPSVRELFEDKGACYSKLRNYYKRDLVVVYSDTDYTHLEDFLNRHHSFIFKPLKGHSGKGIKIYREGVKPQDFFKEMITQGAFVVEELIEQASPMSDIHPQSINTVRIATFKLKERVEIIGTALRMGTGNSAVDNAGSGGIYANIDCVNGYVNTKGRNNKNDQYTIHPDTNIPIVGFKLPEWNDAIRMVKELAYIVKGATMISWDLAYSTKGWLIVEGNDVGDPYLYQAPLQIGKKEKIISLIDKYKKENC